MPELSVIVPAYNSVKSIEKCLLAIRGSSYKEYELIVVDDGSRDGTLLIAEKYADKVVALQENQGRNFSRRKGFEAARAKIIVNIDSDVVVETDTLAKIADYFQSHPDIDAVTGLLSKEHPNRNFFSQYKNLYMHYIFSRLPERVNFLYGSICAVRQEAIRFCDANTEYGVDTAYGQELVSRGKKIAFLKDLEVIHFKKYNFLSFVKNDFNVPAHWAGIFIKYNGWRQLGRNRVGFAHSPMEQLIGVFLVILLVSSVLLFSFGHKYLGLLLLPLGIFWLGLNLRFLHFILREKGWLFVGLSFFATFMDNIIMGTGICYGFFEELIKKVGGLIK